MRTGMACIGLALGLKAVFYDTDYPFVAKGVAQVFILVAIIIFWAAVSECRKTQKRMDSHDVETQSVRRMTGLASLLTIGAVATGVILLLL